MPYAIPVAVMGAEYTFFDMEYVGYFDPVKFFSKFN